MGVVDSVPDEILAGDVIDSMDGSIRHEVVGSLKGLIDDVVGHGVIGAVGGVAVGIRACIVIVSMDGPGGHG